MIREECFESERPVQSSCNKSVNIHAEKNQELTQIWKLPSVETQLMAWFDWAEKWVSHTNTDLTRGGTSLYVRLSHWEANGRCFKFIDFASVTVTKGHRGKGWFSMLCRIAIKCMPFDGIVYECVQNKGLAASLSKSKVIPLHHSEGSSPSFIQIKEDGLYEEYKDAHFSKLEKQ